MRAGAEHMRLASARTSVAMRIHGVVTPDMPIHDRLLRRKRTHVTTATIGHSLRRRVAPAAGGGIDTHMDAQTNQIESVDAIIRRRLLDKHPLPASTARNRHFATSIVT